MKKPLRLTRMLGLPVVDARVARQAGLVSDVQLDVLQLSLAALEVKHGDGWAVERIPAQEIFSFTPYAVLVRDSWAVEVAPLVERPDAWIAGRALLGMEVLDEGGTRVGHIADVLVDTQTSRISSFEVVSGHMERVLRIKKRISPESVTACRDVMIVRAGVRALGIEPVAAPFAHLTVGDPVSESLRPAA